MGSQSQTRLSYFTFLVALIQVLRCDSADYHSLSQLTSGQCLLIGGTERHWEAGGEE